MFRQAFGVRTGSSPGPVGLAPFLLALSGLVSIASAQCPPLLTELPRQSIGGGANRIELADLNGDGRLDLIATLSVGNALQTRMQLPAGGFGPLTSIALPQAPVDFAVGDFNGDAAPDFAVAGASGGLYVVINGVVTTVQTGAVFNYSIATGDANGDGKLDLLVAGRQSGVSVVQLVLWTGNGAGGFTFSRSLTSGISAPPPSGLWCVLEDLNGDGRSDLIVTAGTGLLQIYAGSAQLGLEFPASFLANSATSRAAVADLDGNGTKDLAFTGSNKVWTYVKTGRPLEFNYTARSFDLAGASGMPGVMDLDRDGRADVVVGGLSSQVHVLLGNGDGSLAVQSPFQSTSSNPRSFTAGDVDGDGVPELVAPSGGGGGFDNASFFKRIAPVWTNPFTTHPVGGAIAAGADVALTVAVDRGAVFQWRRGGMPLSNGPQIDGVNAPTLNITGFDLYQIGAYDCVVSGCAVPVVSNPAVLTLETAPPCSIDFNGDGFVDFFDYDDFVRAFEQGC